MMAPYFAPEVGVYNISTASFSTVAATGMTPGSNRYEQDMCVLICACVCIVMNCLDVFSWFLVLRYTIVLSKRWIVENVVFNLIFRLLL